MTNKEFVAKLVLALNNKTLYVKGGFGAPAGYGNNRKRYIDLYPYNRTIIKKPQILNASNDTFFFDCVCLGKGILWGWKADPTKIYGGASYGSNNVPDFTVEEVKKYCGKSYSTDFTSPLTMGEWLYKSGHIGYYIGDGNVIECTGADNGVILSKFNPAKWVGHGKIQFIEYEESIICPYCGREFII